MISRPTAALAGKVEHRGVQPRVAAAQLGGEPAVAAGHVQQPAGPGREAQGARHLGCRQAGQLELAADVPAPMRVVGREVVDLHALAGADHVLEPGPPLPVVEAVLDVRADVGVRGRVEPFAPAYD